MTDQSNHPLFAMLMEDHLFVNQLSAAIRELLKRSDISPVQIHQTAKLLFGLEHLPERIPGIALKVSVSTRESQNLCIFYVSLGEHSFELGTFETMYDERIGTDSISITDFAVTTDERSETGLTELDEWIGVFTMRIKNPEASIEFEDWGDDSQIDWSSQSDESLWDELDSYCV